jgi:hypothetical protein
MNAKKTTPSGDVRLAQEHLRLSRECQERAFELDPTLRPRATPRMANDSDLALDEEAIITRALERAKLKGSNMSRSRPTGRGIIAARRKLARVNQLLGSRMAFDASAGAEERLKTVKEHLRRILELLDGEDPAEDERTEAERDLASELSRDGVGETRARSAVNLGADSALTDFDADALFQRGLT